MSGYLGTEAAIDSDEHVARNDTCTGGGRILKHLIDDKAPGFAFNHEGGTGDDSRRTEPDMGCGAQ